MLYKPNAIIMDIDGTLSCPGDRLKHVKEFTNGKDKGWKKFYDEVDKDICHNEIAWLARIFDNIGDTIIIITSRSYVSQEKTIKWLRDNCIPFNILLMREPDDFVTPSEDLKEGYLKALENSYNILYAFDDEECNIEMFRRYTDACLCKDGKIVKIYKRKEPQ